VPESVMDDIASSIATALEPDARSGGVSQ